MSGDDKWHNAFRKRHRTVFNKAHELKQQAPNDIRVYVLIERRDDESLYYWNSDPADGDWPLDSSAFVSANHRKSTQSLRV